MTHRTAVIATFALLSACTHPPALEAPEGVQLTPLKTISTFKARVLLTLSGVDGISVENSVDCYQMRYTAGSAATPFD